MPSETETFDSPANGVQLLTVTTSGGRHIAVTQYRGADPRDGIVVYLHGGAWIMGSHRDHSERLQALADAGPTVLSIDYRLAVEAPFPAPREDVEAVVSAVVPAGEPFVLMGASAGAHLAALSAFTMTRRPAGFVGLFGRYDLTATAADILPPPDARVPDEILQTAPPAGFAGLSHRDRLALLAGTTTADLGETHLEALSPVYRLTSDAPTILALHGTSDGVVAPGHSERLVAVAERAGISARLVLLPGANHEDPAFARPDIAATIAEFVREQTRKESQEISWVK